MRIEADTNGFIATCELCQERVRDAHMWGAWEHMAEHVELEHKGNK